MVFWAAMALHSSFTPFGFLITVVLWPYKQIFFFAPRMLLVWKASAEVGVFDSGWLDSSAPNRLMVEKRRVFYDCGNLFQQKNTRS